MDVERRLKNPASSLPSQEPARYLRADIIANFMKTLRLFLAVILLSGLALAQSPSRKPAPDVTVIHAGHMLDVKTGNTLNDVWVVIEGGKIVRVGTGAEAAANIIELPGATLLPGLIDAHTHLTSDPNFGYQELGVSVPKEALIGAKNARVTLE